MENPDLSKGAAWMDGAIIPVSEATISVMDWGFTRSDATYDVVQVWDGAFFRLEDHLTRFSTSLDKMHLTIEQSPDDIRAILHQMAAASNLRHAYCAFVATRGVQMVPGSRDPRTCRSRFFAWIVPYVHVIAEDVVARGARLKIAEKVERISTRAVDPTAKNYHWGDITKGLFEALDQGFDTVALVDHHGNITEGPGFNVFCVRDGVVMTPVSGVLEGISRKSALEIAQSLGLPVQLREISKAEFMEADEVFLTSSGGGIVPITEVDTRILSNGKPGPITLKMRDEYYRWRKGGPHCTPINYDG